LIICLSLEISVDTFMFQYFKHTATVSATHHDPVCFRRLNSLFYGTVEFCAATARQLSKQPTENKKLPTATAVGSNKMAI
jgi:hypothetical protein